MNKLSIFLLAAIASSVHAEVFKCQLADKTVYQSTPCPQATIQQHILEIPTTPTDKVAEAEQRLREWKTDFAVREAAELKAQKERQAELDKQAEINALKRSAKAQEDLAEAARQPIVINQTPVFIGRRPHFIRDWHDRDRSDRPRPDKPPRNQDGMPPRTRWIAP